MERRRKGGGCGRAPPVNHALIWKTNLTCRARAVCLGEIWQGTSSPHSYHSSLVRVPMYVCVSLDWLNSVRLNPLVGPFHLEKPANHSGLLTILASGSKFPSFRFSSPSFRLFDDQSLSQLSIFARNQLEWQQTMCHLSDKNAFLSVSCRERPLTLCRER